MSPHITTQKSINQARDNCQISFCDKDAKGVVQKQLASKQLLKKVIYLMID